MKDFNQSPMSIRISVLSYLIVILGVSGYLAMTELRYAIPLAVTGLVGAFFAVYQQGRMTIISALLGLVLNLVLLFGMAAQDIFMAIQNGEIPNLHYGLPLVAGLFGYLLGQVNQLMNDPSQESDDELPANVRVMRPLPTDKDLALLESQISETVSRAVAQGIAEGVSQGLQQALHPTRVVERKSA